MKIVIIEDEKNAALDLAKTITAVSPDTEIVSILYSVDEALSYFNENPAPDLIFSDIQLGDGLSFQIYKAVEIDAPVIFCTAFDEYALSAFKTNGIEYIMKPFTRKTIADALGKYRNLQKKFQNGISQYDKLIDVLSKREISDTTSILVYKKDKILPIKLENIAMFYIEDEMTHILAFDGQKYQVNKKMEDLDKTTGNLFFRINRQQLVSRKAILHVSQYFSRKLSITLSVPFRDKIITSVNKTQPFLTWLENN